MKSTKPAYHKYRIRKLMNQMIRDKWGAPTECCWNDWMKEEIGKSNTYIK